MKKALSIFAVMVFSIGLFSCEADTNIEETDALFENIDESSCDGCSSGSGERGGNG